MNGLILFLQQHIVSYIFLVIFGLITIHRVGNSFQIKRSLQIIKLILIGYALLNIINLAVHLLVDNNYQENQFAFYNRANGVYFWTFLFMIVCSSILPFILLIKRIGNNKWILLVLSFLISLGSFFEKFVIITTSLYRERVEWYYYINTLTIGAALTLILIIINIFYKKSIEENELLDS